ncbi:hypothetical protein Slin15195_G040660 [Septoria linicola]|uniref:Uncharacterized protein n=1 Tax=Septoria linicola TaxID=215465 RepID=A0A9Q9EI81_9PEZI|nr:hypothetical protein Slin14017_G044190 [Septoria linicola]USW50747.1 hypothetical protein Slin15195_G040660 [Septoria linicola]
MTKRRRERDRPKHAPESGYDPSKRVLLSYGSDDEDVEAATHQVEKAAELAVDRSRLANYSTTRNRGDEEEGEVTLGAIDTSAAPTRLTSMGTTAPAQHKQEEDAATEVAELPVKGEPNAKSTQRGTANGRQPRASKFDTGQRQALGAMSNEYDEEYDDDEYDTTTDEAMAYLNSVRTEREAMPEILAAARQVSDNYNNEGEEDDADEYWPDDDDAYVALPEVAADPVEDMTNPQNVFTKSLRDRLMLQREHLHMATSPTALAELGEGFPVSYEEDSNKSRAEWQRILGSKPPMPAQLRAMNQDIVFRVLQLLLDSYLTKGRNIKKVTSAWIWALLCRLDDVGNLNNDQVYPLRELGKRVIFLQLHFSDPEAAAQLEALEQQGHSPAAADDAPADEGNKSFNGTETEATTPSGQQEKDDQAGPSENTLATLDMILVVVGEMFGQRDLLEFRRPWTEAEAQAVT